HVPLEVEDQVFGVHAAPIVVVYGANDMAPWGHMYVNRGLTEPSNIEQGALNFANKTLMPECTELEKAFSNVLWSIGLKDCYVQF
uniref:hypothetical protein n=1 Tax=Collinsella aerofaciens TaxID=74426 RepID=UPI001E5307A2